MMIDYALEQDQRLITELADGRLSDDEFLDLLGPPLPERHYNPIRTRDRVPLARRAPALNRWRKEVLRQARRRPALEVAAAWELTALECEAAGEQAGASRARAAAERTMCGLRRAG